MVPRFFMGLALVAPAVLACSLAADREAEFERVGARAATEDAGGAPIASYVEIVAGVPSRGRDPAVVALEVADAGICSGALISPRLVLTARHCVSRTVASVECPPTGVQILAERPASDVSVLVGEDVVTARRVARGAAVIAPGGVTLCDADIAVLVLDEPVVTAKPLPVAARGPVTGERIRAVGFGRPRDGDPGGKKLLREHVRVLSVSSAEFRVGEATCQGDSGGPALDETTGEVLGLVSRGGPSCEGLDVHNVYTRVDAYAWLIEEAFMRVAEMEVEEKIDAGASNPPTKPAKRGSKQRPPTDVGGPCENGADCAAGICIAEPLEGTGQMRSYCSRTCGPGDRCPNRYHCHKVAGLGPGGSACIKVR